MVSGVTSVNRTQTTAQTAASAKTSSGFSEALKSATKTAGSLDGIFTSAAEKYSVPVGLLKAVAKAESGFQTDAVSSCGAQGIMQLMPSTASSLGVTDSFNPEQNIMGGAKYLGQLLSSFGGDAKLAVAAYNAGGGAVREYGGVPPYAETQSYVKKVLGYAGMELSASGWSGGTSSSSCASGADASSGTAGSFTLGNVSFSTEDYQLFAKMYVQRLEQGALQDATENAARDGQYVV